MNTNSLPYEVITRCFSYLSTKLLVKILLLENIPDHIVESAAENCNNLWYSKRIRSDKKQKVEGSKAYYERDFDQLLRIHKIFEEKAHKRPLWFHYTWENVIDMQQNLDEINLAYNGQDLGIHAYLADPAFQICPTFSDHDINLKVTCLSLKTSFPYFRCCIDLNNFPKLETFYGERCEISVDYNHPSLKNFYLDRVTFSSLPIKLKKLVAKECYIRMKENHPKLEALTTLVLENTREPADSSSLVRVLWNENLETFSYIGERVADEDEIFSMPCPKLTSLGKAGPIPAAIPMQLSSLISIKGGRFKNLTSFTHMTSLTLREPKGNINSLELPPNLLELTLYRPTGEIDSLIFPFSLVKLSIRDAKFKDLSNVDLPPKIVDLELLGCELTLTVGWLKPVLLKKLSLAGNQLSSFTASLPCCEFLCLSFNKIKKVEIEAPVIEHLDLNKNMMTSIPQLPDCLQVLIFTENKLNLSKMSKLPSSLKLLDLLGGLVRSGTGVLQNYTFPPSIQELHLSQLNMSRMSGVNFGEGSELKELNMRDCRLKTINDRMIELPLGLKSLDLSLNDLQKIDDFTIPRTVTLLDLRHNRLKSFKVKSHIETLDLYENRGLSVLKIPKDLELRVLDLTETGLVQLPIDLIEANKLTQLRLGLGFEVIDVEKMPVNLQIVEYPDFNAARFPQFYETGFDEIEGLHRYPNTNIWRRDL